MANRKITAMTALTAPAESDVLPIVDVSEAAATDKNKKITVQELFKGAPSGTESAPGIAFEADDGNGIYLAGTDNVAISTGGSQRISVTNTGTTITGNLTVQGATTSISSTTINVDDKNIELGAVDTPTDTTADGGGITLKGATDKTIKWVNSTGYWTFNTGIEVEGYVQVDDNYGLRIGTGQDLKIFHDGTNNYIKADNGNIIIKSATSDFFEGVASTGVVNVKHNGTTKLATKSDGVNVIGELECDSLDVDGGIDIDGGKIFYDASTDNLHFGDDVQLRIGTSSDLQIYHDGSASYIADNGTGNLNIQTNGGGVVLTKGSSENLAKFIVDGAVELYHDNTKKLETTSDGATVNGTGSLTLPVGTTAQRPSSAAEGMIRRNTTDSAFEGYTGTSWAPLGGGATGGGSDAWVVETDQTVTTSYELGSGKHGTTVSPTINSGATITVPSGAILVIL